MPPTFTKDWDAPDALPAESVQNALALIRSGRLHRYQLPNSAQDGEVSKLEVEFARLMGTKYCSAVNSCGCGMFLALKGLLVGPGDIVFVNAHTLTPVPSSVVHCGATPVLVECTRSGVVDLAHLEAQIKAHRGGTSTGTQANPGGDSTGQTSSKRVLLLSHMRSRICDMDAVAALCHREGVTLVEDCAHALGSSWNGRAIGSFGVVSIFSTQTNKLINSGEGGLIVTDDDEVAGRVILHSGSYGFFTAGHPLLPPASVMQRLHDCTPNFSMRMTNLTAALIRPQLREMDAKVVKLNLNYSTFADLIQTIQPSGAVVVPARLGKEGIVGSSLQFELDRGMFDQAAVERVVAGMNERGVKVAWFGRPDFKNFTSTHRHWSYVADAGGNQGSKALPLTTDMQSHLCDVPLYHTVAWDAARDFKAIVEVMQHVVAAELESSPAKARL